MEWGRRELGGDGSHQHTHSLAECEGTDNDGGGEGGDAAKCC